MKNRSVKVTVKNAIHLKTTIQLCDEKAEFLRLTCEGTTWIMDRTQARDLLESGILHRILHIFSAILADYYPNANTLARELRVSCRSVARDIDFMRNSMQLPIAYDERRHGFYCDKNSPLCSL